MPDYNQHVMAARMFYSTHIPRIDGHTGQHGLPHVFAWVPITTLLSTN